MDWLFYATLAPLCVLFSAVLVVSLYRLAVAAGANRLLDMFRMKRCVQCNGTGTELEPCRFGCGRHTCGRCMGEGRVPFRWRDK